MSAFASRLRGLIRSFASEEEGTIAIIFAIAFVPIIGLVGASIDYSQASSTRADLQAAMDSTALMVSKTAASLSPTELQDKASAYFNALFNRPEATATINAVYASDTVKSVTITGAASVKTSFIGVVGFPKIDISTESVVKWGNIRLRLALVLDVTGSMDSAGKIGALKTASKALLTQLQAAAVNNGDVYVSIVPFAKDVNVGTTNKNETWINWALWDAKHGSCSKKPDKNHTKSECLDDGGTWTVASHDTWNGCVTDRDQDYDTKNTAPAVATPATLFPAEQYNACPTTIMALSYNWTNLNSKIDALSPNGGTNQAIGLQWGFQSLTSAPFTIPSKDPNYVYKEVIILFTDGLNTQDRWYGTGFSHDSRIDDRQKILCDNVKAAGITLYTVQVSTDGDAVSTMLKQCASSENKFFMLTAANQIVTTFQQIGTELAALRVAK